MELLAPAGNLDKLKTSVLYGADAVYLAGQKFSLRGASDNFSETELSEGILFAQKNKCKTYVTLNAFLFDKEINLLPEYIKILEDCGVDALIVSDLGVMTVIQKNSKLPIHLSTQASCLNVHSAKLWKNLGAKRLVLGREVSLKEAEIIRKEVDIEVEMFIHGSMCMAYSGNCVISNYTAGRDSNRGGCIQSCRFYYTDTDEYFEKKDTGTKINSGSLMSSKDLRGIELIPEFIKAGIDSIKVEGRMKSSLYAATTSNAYAQALKWCYTRPKEEWVPKLKYFAGILEKIPHREYSEGYLKVCADSESIYRGGRNKTNTSYEIAGTVMELNQDNSFTLMIQNSFERGVILELLTFEGNIIKIPTHEMRDISGLPILKAKPNHLVRIPYPHVDSNLIENFTDSSIELMNVVRLEAI